MISRINICGLQKRNDSVWKPFLTLPDNQIEIPEPVVTRATENVEVYKKLRGRSLTVTDSTSTRTLKFLQNFIMIIIKSKLIEKAINTPRDHLKLKSLLNHALN